MSTTAVGSPATPRPSVPGYGLGLAVVVVGVLIAAVDTTIVVLALPKLMVDLHMATTDAIWVIISYLLVITVLATQVGKLGDMLGRIRMYEAGFAVFVVGSLLCGLAVNEVTLIAFRVLQGLGGALISANSGAVIADIVPPEKRGRAFGFNAIGWNLGAILGIVLGGLITTVTSWRWVFLINVPIGILALLTALRVLHDSGSRQRHRIDWPGTLGLGLGLLAILYGATELTSQTSAATIIASFTAGVVILAAFVLWERRAAEPVIELAIFRIPTMSPALAASFLQALANFAVLFNVIMYLQGVRDLSPLNASLLLVPGYMLGAVVAPIAGRLADRVGPAIPATGGLVIQVVALLIYAQLAPHSSYWLIVIASCISGIGSGGFFPANTSAVMKAAPGRAFGLASGMLRTVANVGMVFSFSVALLVASHALSAATASRIFVQSTQLSPADSTAFSNALHAAFLMSAALMLVAAVLSAARGRPRPDVAQRELLHGQPG